MNEPIYDGEEETELTWKYNTGIVVGYDIKQAVEVIKSNPIGCLLS